MATIIMLRALEAIIFGATLADSQTSSKKGKSDHSQSAINQQLQLRSLQSLQSSPELSGDLFNSLDAPAAPAKIQVLLMECVKHFNKTAIYQAGSLPKVAYGQATLPVYSVIPYGHDSTSAKPG